MDFCKSFHFGFINVYVTTCRMKRRSKHDDLYRNRRKKLLRMKHKMWKQNGGRCEECGKQMDEEALEIHHIVPVSVRPELIASRSNLHLVCPECHAKLHGRPVCGGGYFRECPYRMKKNP